MRKRKQKNPSSMTFQENLAYNARLLQKAYGYDATEMSKVIHSSPANWSQKKTRKVGFVLSDLALLGSHFNVDLNLLVYGKIKVDRKVNVSVSVDADNQ